MGNEMGKNNVTSQEVSEETAKGFEKTVDRLNGSPGLTSTNSMEKDDTKDVDKSKPLKDPIIPNGGDGKIVSDQNNSSIKREDLDDKTMDSLQDHPFIQVDDNNSNLPTEQDDEPVKNEGNETDTNSKEPVVPVSTTIEDMTSSRDILTSDEQFKQLVHETRERSAENTESNSQMLLEENAEGSLDEEKIYSYAAMVGNLVGEETVENLEQGQTEVSTVECPLMPMKGGSKSSTETITDYLDADDSEIKEVVIEDEPTGIDSLPYVRPADGDNLQTSKNDNSDIEEEKEEICEISRTAAVEMVIGSCEVIHEDKKIHGLKIQDKDPCGAFDISEVVSATDFTELGKDEVNKRVVAVAGQISDSVKQTEEHNLIERTHTRPEHVADKAVAVKNLADNCKEEKEADSIHVAFSLIEVNGNGFTGLDSSLSYHLPTVNEEKVQAEVNEGFFTPMTASPSPAQLPDDFHKRDIKLDSPYSNEGIISSTYGAKTTDIQETMARSQCDQPHQMLPEEPEVVKFESSSILSSCMKVEDCSKTGIIFPNGSNQERVSASATATGFTFESNQEKVTVNVGFTVELNKKKIIVNNDKAIEEEYLLQTPAPGRDAGEEIPLLPRVENTSSFSYSTEQLDKVIETIPITNITPIQVKNITVEECDKSPLLSPREPSEGNLIAVRSKKPLQSLMTGSPLKEQEAFTNNSTMVSSPRSKEKQKSRSSSLFASCMCCATATN